MSSIATANSGGIVVKVAQCIRDNKEYLSTIDGLIGDGDHSDRRNLQLYVREIDHPQKYFRHVASIADPTTEATFTLISKDYLIISISNDKFAVKYSE